MSELDFEASLGMSLHYESEIFHIKTNGAGSLIICLGLVMGLIWFASLPSSESSLRYRYICHTSESINKSFTFGINL